MQLRKLALSAASVAIGLIAIPPIARADSFSAVVVYGDSLSDNGNIYKLTGSPASPPYDNGRFSNGPVAVEQLAISLGAPLLDFAYGGATSGVGNYGDGGTQTTAGKYGLPGMEAELVGSKPYVPTQIIPSALFIVWGGANDYLVNGTPQIGVADIDGIVAALEAEGAQHILVPGVPDLGLTPDYFGDPTATAYSQQFNALLQATLPAGATYVDTFGLLQGIESHPADYGFTDITDPCLNPVTGAVCANPSQYLFWDGFHPTTTADAILESQFSIAINQTPEPSSFLLLGTGLSGLGVLIRRRLAA